MKRQRNLTVKDITCMFARTRESTWESIEATKISKNTNPFLPNAIQTTDWTTENNFRVRTEERPPESGKYNITIFDESVAVEAQARGVAALEMPDYVFLSRHNLNRKQAETLHRKVLTYLSAGGY